MGWFDSGNFQIQQGATKGTYRFRVTFQGSHHVNPDRLTQLVSRTDLLGMRREINRALKQDKETQDEKR